MTEETKILVAIGGILTHPTFNPTEKLKRIARVYHKWAYTDYEATECQNPSAKSNELLSSSA